MEKIDTFKSSLNESHPPLSLSLALRALWYDAKNDWHKAHDLAQEKENNDGSWVHAYLHRKEGDEFNAAYWYRRAAKPVCKLTLQEEWEQIAKALLGNENP
jgi:hypothetical protein